MAQVVPLRPSGNGPLQVCGCGRDAENEKALSFYFSRPVTDDEMRFLHEVMERSAHLYRAMKEGT